MKKIHTIINFSLMLIIPGVLYTYYYPWLYNKINSYTNRSLPLDDDIDLVNSILIFIVTWLFFVILSLVNILLK
tara:strand:+ start:935 stop:1156 length:222 start_codon:yes stop_codon:yes gene_type:complete